MYRRLSVRLKIETTRYNDCTLGRLTVEGNEFQCFTMELPDNGNRVNVSCIPAGVYQAFKRYSPSKDCEVIQLLDVPNRTYIQIHVGNYLHQIKGCILVGLGNKLKKGQPMITDSSYAFNKLMGLCPDELEVEIVRR